MAGKKILVIDVDVASRNFVARALQHQQNEIIQVDSGKEGLISAWRDHPDLIIMEPTLPDLKGEDLAAKLRQDPRTANVPLIALSADRTATRLKSCLDAGFNEFIIKSGQAVSALPEAVSRLLGDAPMDAGKGGLLIVFISAKGGIGTSSLCANLAMNICTNQPEVNVAVVDLVLPIGSIAQIVGYNEEQNVVVAADLPPDQMNAEFFRNNLVKMENWRFYLLAGSPDPESATHMQVGQTQKIINGIKSDYDYVLVDIGRSLSKFTLPLIQQADLITLIVSTDSSTVSLSKTLLDYLRSKGVRNSSIFTILNRAVGLEGLTKAEAEKILEIEIKTTIPYLGGTFTLANNQHQPFTLKYPTDTTTIIFKELAGQMVETARRLRTP